MSFTRNIIKENEMSKFTAVEEIKLITEVAARLYASRDFVNIQNDKREELRSDCVTDAMNIIGEAEEQYNKAVEKLDAAKK